MRNTIRGIFLATMIGVVATGYSQPQPVNAARDTLISAGPEYKTSSFHQWLWGANNRKDWAVPVRVPVIYLDKTYGGLKPVKAGGGNQTKSLQVERSDGNRYALRTVNKTLGKVLPDEFLGTFIEDLVNDKVSMSHPYGAAVVPGLANAAGLYHTYPQFVYMPGQPALDTFNNVFANKLYLFEKKIDDDWREADHLGNYEDYRSTSTLLENLLEDNDHKVNQRDFVRARLLDMLINDWDRHEDQWEWGEREVGDQKIYTAVPQDRDQAFFNYNGVLLKLMIGAAGLNYFQPFKDDIKNVKTFNYEQRNLDRLFANELNWQDWQQIADSLQTALADHVIDSSVKQLPPESYALSGQQIASTLKARRNKLKEWADTYYRFIAREVDIPGSQKHEHFEVNLLDENTMQVNVYKKNKEGAIKHRLYSRTFNRNETREVRLYGVAGNDRFTVNGKESNIKLRLIGGVEKDSISVAGGRVHVYENPGENVLNVSRSTRVHLAEDTAINSFRYGHFLYSKRGLKPVVFYSNDDRLYAGLSYSILTNKWRKLPFASKQRIDANYSISQRAFSFIYNGYFPQVLGKTDLWLRGMYDQVKWTNFFGLGNESRFTVNDIDFYRARTEEWEASLGFVRKLNKHHLQLTTQYQRIRVLQDMERFIGQNIIEPHGNQFAAKNFANAFLNHTLVSVDELIAPSKGFIWSNLVGFTQNINDKDRHVGRFKTDFHWYIPLVSDFSFALRLGGETVTGKPEFYQYASIGGSQEVRAFRRGRYWGKSGVYNSNELRWIKDVKSYLYNGKAGLLLFYDNGRVWMPGEKSDVWHDGYGFGIFLAPFNKLSADVTYGFSRDDRLIQLRLSRNF